MSNINYYIALDGGGTGTRARLFNQKNNELNFIAECSGDSSALGQGVERAWTNILATINKTFTTSGLPLPNLQECSVAIGISGFNNKKWNQAFLSLNPGFGKLVVETDGMTTLLGAHAGEPGLIIALGTGSIGVSKDQNNIIKTVSGWGYPSGDEASGSWLGIKALRVTQKVMDGRRSVSPLSLKVMDTCGSNAESLLDWLGSASQKEFASLAPYIFETAKSDPYSLHLIERGVEEIEEMINALDKTKSLKICMCGTLGKHFSSFLPAHITSRIVTEKGSSLDGAVELLKVDIY